VAQRPGILIGRQFGQFVATFERQYRGNDGELRRLGVDGRFPGWWIKGLPIGQRRADDARMADHFFSFATRNPSPPISITYRR
jgi:hypothetical protein